MDTWNSKSVGDGVAAFQPSMQLHQAFLNMASASAGVPANAAVFSYYELDTNVVTWYFSPEATSLAKMFGATPCDKPTPSKGFGLLVGDGRSWGAHFPNYLANRRNEC